MLFIYSDLDSLKLLYYTHWYESRIILLSRLLKSPRVHVIVVVPHSSPMKTVGGKVRVGNTERRQQLSYPLESKCIPQYWYIEVHDIATKSMLWDGL